MISAKIIKDSINTYTNDRLTTFIVTFPRIVLSEFNTHRVFSRNSASSRAIPYKKMVEMVKKNPFIPLHFQEDHKGMQGTKNIEGFKLKLVRAVWLFARNCAVWASSMLNRLNVTKQLCNRILEPFMWHTVIVSATDWENFFALRAHKDAEIHIQKLAYLMLEEYNKSIPEPMSPLASTWKLISENNELIPNLSTSDFLGPVLMHSPWHMPFADKMPLEIEDVFSKLKIAIARCARISYLTFDGEMNVQKDYEIFQKLIGGNPKHASPAEHVAIPMITSKRFGNLKGWLSYRSTLPDENAHDPRVIKRKVGYTQYKQFEVI